MKAPNNSAGRRLKAVALSVAGVGVAALACGCGSNDSSAGPGFEQAIRAPKGPMPPEARAAMEKAKAGQDTGKPANR